MPPRQGFEFRRRQQLLQGPDCSAANQRRRIIEEKARVIRKRWIATIADGDQNIAQESRASNAFDGRFSEQRAECRIVQPNQFRQARRGQFFARPQIHLPGALREFVPRTHRQAIVAAINAVAHLHAELARDGALILDGEIGNAASRIQPIGRGKGIGGTDIEALPAIAAMIAFAFVRRQVERS